MAPPLEIKPVWRFQTVTPRSDCGTRQTRCRDPVLVTGQSSSVAKGAFGSALSITDQTVHESVNECFGPKHPKDSVFSTKEAVVGHLWRPATRRLQFITDVERRRRLFGLQLSSNNPRALAPGRPSRASFRHTLRLKQEVKEHPGGNEIRQRANHDGAPDPKEGDKDEQSRRRDHQASYLCPQ